MIKVEKSILQTLALFDLFKRPLTLEELWHFLYRLRTSKLGVLTGLRSLEKKKIIFEKDNFFCLKESKKNIAEFKLKKEFLKKRWQKAARIINILKFAPFVKNISIINSLSFNASNPESDIDILLIAKKNRLWTARFFTVILLEIIGQNKNKWYKAGKFCLGFAFDEETLNLKNIRLKEDIYLTYWLANLRPVFDRKTYKNFIKENDWIFQDLPNWTLQKIEAADTKLTFLEKIFFGKMGEKIEKYLAFIQIKRIFTDPENLRFEGSVVASSHMMKLHPYDERESYKIKWQEKVEALSELDKKC